LRKHRSPHYNFSPSLFGGIRSLQISAILTLIGDEKVKTIFHCLMRGHQKRVS